MKGLFYYGDTGFSTSGITEIVRSKQVLVRYSSWETWFVERANTRRMYLLSLSYICKYCLSDVQIM